MTERDQIFISGFEKVYSENLHKIEFYANSFLQDMELSKEVAQNVFLKLWDKRENFNWQQEILPLLVIMAKNECLNILKRNQLKVQHGDWLQYSSRQFMMSSLEKSAQVDIYGKEVQALINKAIEAMPPKVRITYLQSRVENLKNKEIASLQGIGLSTVEFRLACAFRILRKYLKDYIYFLLWFFI